MADCPCGGATRCETRNTVNLRRQRGGYLIPKPFIDGNLDIMEQYAVDALVFHTQGMAKKQ
jgi:hypothetical protein